MANRYNQIGAIERIEVEFMHPISMQPPALLGRERCRDEPARLRIIIESFEMRPHPGRDRGTARRGHALQLREIRDRQYPRHDRHLDTSGAGAVSEAQEHIDVEKELRDRAAGAGIELRL